MKSSTASVATRAPDNGGRTFARVRKPTRRTQQMTTTRTRNRSGDVTADARRTSTNASPANSASNSTDRLPTRGSRASSPGKHTSEDHPNNGSRDGIPSISEGSPSPSREQDFEKLGLWKESEIQAVAAEVAAKKSVDFAKLFGTLANTTMPEQLKHRTRADVKALVDRLKSSFDATVAPWAPKCGVSELLAALACEASFVSSQRVERTKILALVDQGKSDIKRLAKACQDTEGSAKQLAEEVRNQTSLCKDAEERRKSAEQLLSAAKDENEHKERQRQQVEREVDQWKMNELEVRHKLDRVRLKVAALRGQMVTKTIDELARPPPKKPREHGEGLAPGSKGDLSLSRPLKKQRLNPTAASDDVDRNLAKEQDEDVVMAENADTILPASGKGPQLEQNGGPACPTASEEKQNAEEEANASSDEDGMDEDSESMEIRLLKYRHRMCVGEALEWRESAKFERIRRQQITAANARLEEELARYRVNVGISKGGLANDRRLVGKNVAGSATTIPRRMRKVGPAPSPTPGIASPQLSRKSRKGHARRSLVVTEL